MEVRWMLDGTTPKKLVVIPESLKEERILEMLLENDINLKAILLAAHKETEAVGRIGNIEVIEHKGNTWLKAQHL